MLITRTWTTTGIITRVGKESFVWNHLNLYKKIKFYRIDDSYGQVIGNVF